MFNQWEEDCLAYMLKTICEFGVELEDIEACGGDMFEQYETPHTQDTPRKCLRRGRRGSQDKLVIPRLNQVRAITNHSQ